MPGQHVLGDFHFPKGPNTERFSYSVVWEVYLERSVCTRVSRSNFIKQRKQQRGQTKERELLARLGQQKKS